MRGGLDRAFTSPLGRRVFLVTKSTTRWLYTLYFTLPATLPIDSTLYYTSCPACIALSVYPFLFPSLGAWGKHGSIESSWVSLLSIPRSATCDYMMTHRPIALLLVPHSLPRSFLTLLQRLCSLTQHTPRRSSNTLSCALNPFPTSTSPTNAPSNRIRRIIRGLLISRGMLQARACRRRIRALKRRRSRPIVQRRRTGLTRRRRRCR